MLLIDHFPYRNQFSERVFEGHHQTSKGVVVEHVRRVQGDVDGSNRSDDFVDKVNASMGRGGMMIIARPPPSS
jgi:hypothetical protein